MRERDYAYEALAEVTSTDQNEGRGQLNAALKSIREQMPEMDSYVLSAEIHERAKMYRKIMPDVLLTAPALAKHWKRVYEEADRKQGTNLHVGLGCATCDGDKFVLVQSEPEAYAACPDCHSSLDASFWRVDGTRFVPPDPARVRELMAR
jgi:hypothetical protein